MFGNVTQGERDAIDRWNDRRLDRYLSDQYDRLKCDRCGATIDHDGANWGNCTACGDNLCHECAGGFNDDGECELCQKEALK